MKEAAPRAGEAVRRSSGMGVMLEGGGCWFTAMAAGDFTEPTLEQLGALASERSIPAGSFARSPQVHGANVRLVMEQQEAAYEGEFDGQVTCSREVACAVRHADCLPVALISESAVGVIHAGWKGLAAGVLAEGVRAMREAGSDRMTAVIGPGARSCCYEVGYEVHEAFASLGAGARLGENADLPWVAAEQLRRLGVDRQLDLRECTICAPGPRWHSHRRDGEKAGRSLAVAWRT